jgi:acetoacetyl-CoA synthetase
MRQGEAIWTPPADWRERFAMGRYVEWLRTERGLDFAGYDELFRWSVSDLEGFWASIWDFFGVRAHTPYERVLGSREMPGAEWFPGATLNYAEHMLGLDEDLDTVAIVAHSQTRETRELTFGELRDQVARARAGLQRLGVGPGDRVVAYLPNIPETAVAFIAAASLGAIWATCPPEFGVKSVVDRLGQLEPKVLLAVSGYVYGEKLIDRGENVAAIRERLPSLETVIEVPYAGDAISGAISWEELSSEAGPLEFDPVPFAQPLYVLFSSGTTGLPKAIVHGHGGILLEHLKNLGLAWDVQPGDRLQWFTTTAWMMWNALMSTLLLRASIVMIDGNPGYPGFALACRKQGIEPGRQYDLSSLRSLTVAGSPLPVDGFEWIYEQVDKSVLLINGSGGTDVCSGMVQGCPLMPVYAGEIAGPCLGVDVAAFDENGEAVVGELGELVIRQPMPSMAVSFWNDPGYERYRAAYFDHYPGIWRHGDWIIFTERGSCIITGRSDATLNRGGVRLGTSEFYSALEELDEVVDSLVVHLETEDELILFVVLRDGLELDDAMRKRIAGALRDALSPRHVPDTIVALPVIPQTLTGKKLELPVKRILTGVPAAEVVSPDALVNPASIEPVVAYASTRSKS